MNEKKVNKKLIIIMAIITGIVIGIVAFIVCGGDELIISKVKTENEISSSKSKDEDNKIKKDAKNSINRTNTNNTTNTSKNNTINNTTNRVNNNTNSNITNNSNTTNNSNNVNTTQTSNNWASGEFSIDGVKYCLGDYYSKLSNNGWKLENISDDYTIKENSVNYNNILKNEKYKKNLGASFINRTKNVASINDCELYSISISSYTKDYDFEFSIPEGITAGKSTKEDVINAYGQPTKIYSETGLLYQNDSAILRIYVDKNGIVNSITYSKRN